MRASATTSRRGRHLFNERGETGCAGVDVGGTSSVGVDGGGAGAAVGGDGRPRTMLSVGVESAPKRPQTSVASMPPTTAPRLPSIGSHWQ